MGPFVSAGRTSCTRRVVAVRVRRPPTVAPVTRLGDWMCAGAWYKEKRGMISVK